MVKARLFMALFALPFLGVGVWMTWSIASTFLQYQDMKSWEPVRALVVRGDTEVHSGSESTTYKAVADYTYTFGSMEYTGHRVGIDSGADNIGDWQQDWGNKLRGLQGRYTEAYVDPDTPHSSIIDRDIRWGMIGFKMIFVVAFGGAGAFLFFMSFMPANMYSEAEKPEIRDKPWLANREWDKGEIVSSSKGAMYFAWFFTLLWNAISAPLPFLLKREILEKENYPALIALLFPLVGIGLFVWAVRRTLEWKRFGHAPVVLDPFPGSIGGNVGGTIELNYLFDPSAQFLVSLVCYKSDYRRRNSGDNGRDETPVWQDTVVAHTENGLYGTRIIFRFDVPEGLHPTDADKPPRDYYLWRLHVNAELPGPDLDRDYEIPVYATKQKSGYIPARVVENSERATLEREEREAHGKIRVISGPNGTELFYPMGRNIGAALVGMVAGLCFCAPGAFMIWKGGLWFFGGLFFLVGALIFLSCLYLPINSLTVAKDLNGAIITVRRILGIPVKRGYAIPEEIGSIVAESHFATTSGRGKQVKHYTVYALLPHKERLVLGEGFHGTGEADAAIKFIRETLRIRKK